jgi:hypothetical protein
MSEAVQNSDTPSACDKLLDYVYGELSGDDLEQFKLHLLTCEKCKLELAGLERVRSAVKRSLPQVEPPVDKMAQLMHAAAQQKPKRGKVLMFARRMVSHPAYAAAAVFVLVATAVTVNFTRNKLDMPKEAAHEPVVTAEPPPPPPAEAAQPPRAAAQPAPAAPGAMALDDTLDGLAKDKPKIELKTEPAGAYTTTKAPPARKISTATGDELVLNPTMEGYKAPAAPKPAEVRRDDAGGNKTRHHASADIAAEDAKAPSRPAGSPTVVLKPAAPAPEKRESVSMNYGKGAGGERGRVEMETVVAPGAAKESQLAQTPAAQNAPSQVAAGAVAAPPPATSTPALAEKSLDNNNNARQQRTADPMLLRKQFLAYAQSNRCTEAVSTFQEIDKRYSGVLSVNDRLEYVKCLRRSGQNSLADLENKAIAEEQQQQKVNAMRSKKSKASKPASPDKSAPDAAMSPSF